MADTLTHDAAHSTVHDYGNGVPTPQDAERLTAAAIEAAGEREAAVAAEREVRGRRDAAIVAMYRAGMTVPVLHRALNAGGVPLSRSGIRFVLRAAGITRP